MMTDDQKSKVAELKAAIAASAPTAGGAPREVRAAAVSLKGELRQDGDDGARARRGAGDSRDARCVGGSARSVGAVTPGVCGPQQAEGRWRSEGRLDVSHGAR